MCKLIESKQTCPLSGNSHRSNFVIYTNILYYFKQHNTTWWLRYCKLLCTVAWDIGLFSVNYFGQLCVLSLIKWHTGCKAVWATTAAVTQTILRIDGFLCASLLSTHDTSFCAHAHAHEPVAARGILVRPGKSSRWVRVRAAEEERWWKG